MTVSTTDNRIPYSGNGVTTVFDFPYKFLATSDLKVYVDDVLLTLTTDYSVGTPSDDGASVTFVAAPAAGTNNIVILRDPDLLQQSALPSNGPFPSVTVEAMVDKATLVIQRLTELLTRSFRLADSDTSGADTTLPTPASNNVIGWNETATALQNFDPQTFATIVAFGTANSDLFSGNGVLTSFTLSANPGALNNLDVSIGGVTQTPGADYNWTTGTTITFTTAPPLGTNNVLVRYMQGLPIADAASAAWTQSATGAIQRTIGGKLTEWISVKDFGAVGDGVTSDQTAIATAITYCLLTGAELLWPFGSYVSTASISNLHSVRHRGRGAIKRAANLFYVDAINSQANTIYLATTGVDTNDGLSTSQPKLTFQSAFDALANYGNPILDGVWTISSAAGTYTISEGSHNFTTPSKNRVIVKGPAVGGHPNVPTCFIDGGGNQSSYKHGLNFDGVGVRVQVQDIKARNFTEAAGYTRLGFVFANGGDAYVVNCHSFACSWAGADFKELSAARISGGIWDANNVGAFGVLMDSTRGSFGYNSTSNADAPTIKKAISAGLYWGTGSQGHADYVNYEDCGVGFLGAENSRCDTVGSNYKRNTVAKRLMTGAFAASGGAAENFNNGTADANTTNVEYKAYSGDSSELDDQGSGSWQRVAFDRANRALSGVTPTILTTPYTIEAYRLQGVGKSCNVKAYGVWTALTAGSTITVNFGGLALTFTVPGAATTAPFEIDATLFEAAGGYRAVGRLTQGLSQTRMAYQSAGFVNSSAQAVSIGATLANAGDSMNIYRTDVFLIG